MPSSGSGCARTVQPRSRKERRSPALSDHDLSTAASASVSLQKIMFTGMSLTLGLCGVGSRWVGVVRKFVELFSRTKEPGGGAQPSMRSNEGARGPVGQVQSLFGQVMQSLPRKDGKEGCAGGAGSGWGSVAAAARAAAISDACPLLGPAVLISA